MNTSPFIDIGTIESGENTRNSSQEEEDVLDSNAFMNQIISFPDLVTSSPSSELDNEPWNIIASDFQTSNITRNTNYDVISSTNSLQTNNNLNSTQFQPLATNNSITNNSVTNAPISMTVPQKSQCTVGLYHKPKGSKGLWKEIELGEKIRVTKGNGKILKLSIQAPHEIDKNTLQIFLEDIDFKITFSPSQQGPNSYTLEFIRVQDKMAEVTLKLFRMGGKLDFLIQFLPLRKEFGTISGRSVNFIAYGSGTTKEKESSVSDAKKRKINNDETIQSHISSPSSDNNSSPLSGGISPQLQQTKTTVAPSDIMPMDDHFISNVTSNGNNNNNNGAMENNTLYLPGSLDVKGVVKAKAFMQFSDARLKTNIADIVDAIQIVTSLQGKTYQWKKEAFIGASVPDSDTDNDSSGSAISEETVGTPGAKKVIGLIAQEVQRVLPEVVHEDPETGLLTVSYVEILPVLIEAFKQFLNQYKNDKVELQSQLDDLKLQLDKVAQEFENAKMNPKKVQRLLKGLTMSSKTLSLQLKNHVLSDSSTQPVLLKVSPSTSRTPTSIPNAKLHVSTSSSESEEELATLYKPNVSSGHMEKEEKISVSLEDERDTARNLNESSDRQRLKLKNQTMRKQALKRKYGGTLFCRITRAVCAFLFLLSLVIAIIGIAITYTNAESDMLRVLGQQFASDVAVQYTLTDINWTAGLVLGVVFFSLGIVGTCCSSLGICCSSFFLCAQDKRNKE